MVDIARSVRIFDPNPTDDLVLKRTKGVEALAVKYGKAKTVSDLLQIAHDVVSGLSSVTFDLPDARVEEIELILRKESPSFDRAGEQLQILVCAMLALQKLFEEATPGSVVWTRTEVIAVGIWLGFSALPPLREVKLEKLRLDLQSAGRKLVILSTESARERQPIPDPDLKLADLTDVAKVNVGINNAVLKLIEGLRDNAALDREEIDLLWWSLGEWSELQGRSYRDMPASSAAISAGVDAANLMRRLPGEAHKQLVLRRVSGEEILTLAELIDQSKAEIDPIRQKFAGSFVTSFPKIFCLLSGILTTPSELSLDLRDWGSRALLEASVMKVSSITAAV